MASIKPVGGTPTLPGLNGIVPAESVLENSVQDGTDHRLVALGYQSAAGFGGRLPPRTGW